MGENGTPLSNIDLDTIIQLIDDVEPVHYLSGTSSADRRFDLLPSIDRSHLTKPPSVDEVEHQYYNFEVNLPGEKSGKNSWVVSFFFFHLKKTPIFY